MVFIQIIDSSWNNQENNNICKKKLFPIQSEAVNVQRKTVD